MIGSTLGNYRVDAKIGAGGMGAVYRATDLKLGRVVAIKTLTAVSGIAQREALARFLREAKVQSRIQHPAIVAIHQIGTADDLRYIVMEYVEGKTLKEILRAEPMAPMQICEYGIQIAEGLAVAHEAGIIHRDMKSQNVMITARGQVKVLDFGLAKLKEGPVSSIAPAAAPADVGKTMVYGEEPAEEAPPPDPGDFKTKVGTIMGTATNMSPEQCLGTEVDARSDMFSLGVVFYEMATGKMPFDAPLAAALLMQILQKEPIPVREVVPDIPPELARLIHQCLSKERERRPTASQVAASLKKIQAMLHAGATSFTPEPRPVAADLPSTLKMERLPSAAYQVQEPPPEPPRQVVAAPPRPRMPVVTEEPPAAARFYSAIRFVRISASIAMVGWALAYVADFLIRANVISGKQLEGTFVLGLIRLLVAPGMALAESVIKLQSGRWNFLLLVLAAITFVLRHFVLLVLEKMELRARTR